MWSLSPECRTNNIYYQILKDLDQRLYSLPWARSGVAPDGTTENNPSLTINYHKWSEWLQKDLQAQIEPLITSPRLEELGIFNKSSIIRFYKKWLEESDTKLGNGENVIKLCSIEIAREFYGLHS
jgi:asparagine synthase (glutamine-hydrolysing)